MATWVDAYGRLPTPQEAAVLVQRDPRFSRPSTYLPYLRLLGDAWRGLSVGEIAARTHVPVDDLYRPEGDIIDTDGYAFVDEHELRWITPEGRDHVVLSGLTIGQMLDRLDQPRRTLLRLRRCIPARDGAAGCTSRSLKRLQTGTYSLV